MDDFDSLLDTTGFGLILTASIGKSVFAHLEEIVPEEQAPDWVLDCLHHLENVFENAVRALVMTLDVNASHCDQQVQSGNDIGRMLDGLVQVDHSPSPSEIVLEVVLEL